MNANSFCGEVKWECPSNIALVKYWGKRGEQLPQNPSVSFTLSRCATTTSIAFETASEFFSDFYFDGQPNPLFHDKITKFIAKYIDHFPALKTLRCTISSSNSFPHSSGIASSASSMSALVMCLLDIDRMARGEESIDMTKASFLARLASGSASRSVYPKMSLWGRTDAIEDSSDYYAVGIGQHVHRVFDDYQDTILIVSDAEKSVSSRAGHALMNDNAFAESRYNQARQHTEALLSALRSGDIDAFITIVEAEALQLHALMMCSSPSFILMRPASLAIIERIRRYRHDTGIPVCFTLDAGPNVHVIYPSSYTEDVRAFIESELSEYCVNRYYIHDEVGQGPCRC